MAVDKDCVKTIVICRVNIITVHMYEKLVVQSLILSAGRQGMAGFFAALGLTFGTSELQICLTTWSWLILFHTRNAT
jgi:hypothetical protein